MGTKLVRNNKFLAVLLAINGVLNGIYLNDVLYVIPFAIAALQFYTTPPAWKLRRWLILFSVVVVALSLQLSVAYFVNGITNGDTTALIEGVTLLIVNGLILANFMLTRGTGEATSSL